MIVKMKFLSITGPKDDIERMAGQYLSKYEIQLENALTELKTVRDLRPFAEKNPYEAELRRAREWLPAELPAGEKVPDMTAKRAVETLRELEGTTKIIIAHRISAVRHADEIIVLENGSIAERGTHEELLAKRGLYFETYESQYGDMDTAAALQQTINLLPETGNRKETVTEVEQQRGGGKVGSQLV